MCVDDMTEFKPAENEIVAYKAANVTNYGAQSLISPKFRYPQYDDSSDRGLVRLYKVGKIYNCGPPGFYCIQRQEDFEFICSMGWAPVLLEVTIPSGALVSFGKYKMNGVITIPCINATKIKVQRCLASA